MWWFGAEETFLISFNVENSGAASISVKTTTILFQDSLMKGKLKREQLLDTKIFNITNVFTVTFDQFNAS